MNLKKPMKKRILTLISCHTNSLLKIGALLHSLEHFINVSTTIIVINSTEFKTSNLETLVQRKYSKKAIFLKYWAERRDAGCNIYFAYKDNDKLISHGKWMFVLKSIPYQNFEHIILTNDSIVVTQPLHPFIALANPNTEMVALLESYEVKHHYPDFLRLYTPSGIVKLLRFFIKNIDGITNFKSVVKLYEIESGSLFERVNVLYPGDPTFQGNIHFCDVRLPAYLYEKNYPVVKIKKLQFTTYFDKTVPSDFNAAEYRNMQPDLEGFSEKEAEEHFITSGMTEGRLYKKNQPLIRPPYLLRYMAAVGFPIS
jgi:hypothetical protein